MRLVFALALTLAGGSLPVAADAALVTFRFTGDINYVMPGQSVDPFGIPDGPLAQTYAYSYDVTYDTSIGAKFESPTASYLQGIGYSISPIRSWALTINGVTDGWTVGPNEFYNNRVERTGGPSAGQIAIQHDGGIGYNFYWAGLVNVTSYAANSAYLADPFVSQNPVGIARFVHYQNNGGAYSTFYWISGNVTGVRLMPPAGAVPEPESWALLILGFGVVGAAARRRPARIRVS